MTQELPEGRWVELHEFPGYFLGDVGRVFNQSTGIQLAVSKNSHGCPIVGMMKNGVQVKRSLPQLVAQTFLSKPESEAFDTPIHLDGYRENCHYTNLMWRPLWFSRKYMRQFTDQHRTCIAPIEDVESGKVYETSMDAAMVHGLLDAEICLAMMENGYVWPTRQMFRRHVSG